MHGFNRVYDLALNFIEPLGSEAVGKFFGENATKFYGLMVV
jgi:hypothetical protein